MSSVPKVDPKTGADLQRVFDQIRNNPELVRQTDPKGLAKQADGILSRSQLEFLEKVDVDVFAQVRANVLRREIQDTGAAGDASALREQAGWYRGDGQFEAFKAAGDIPLDLTVPSGAFAGMRFVWQAKARLGTSRQFEQTLRSYKGAAAAGDLESIMGAAGSAWKVHKGHLEVRTTYQMKDGIRLTLIERDGKEQRRVFTNPSGVQLTQTRFPSGDGVESFMTFPWGPDDGRLSPIARDDNGLTFFESALANSAAVLRLRTPKDRAMFKLKPPTKTAGDRLPPRPRVEFGLSLAAEEVSLDTEKMIAEGEKVLEDRRQFFEVRGPGASTGGQPDLEVLVASLTGQNAPARGLFDIEITPNAAVGAERDKQLQNIAKLLISKDGEPVKLKAEEAARKMGMIK